VSLAETRKAPQGIGRQAHQAPFFALFAFGHRLFPKWAGDDGPPTITAAEKKSKPQPRIRASQPQEATANPKKLGGPAA
jgi:hypothetical protein